MVLNLVYTTFIILFVILFIILLIYLNKNLKNLQTKDNFISINNDPVNDGKMKFDFITDPNYTKNILNKYYLNDDTKTKNVRNVYHPYQFKKGSYYGNPKFNILNGSSSNITYEKYGIRM